MKRSITRRKTNTVTETGTAEQTQSAQYNEGQHEKALQNASSADHEEVTPNVPDTSPEAQALSAPAATPEHVEPELSSEQSSNVKNPLGLGNRRKRKPITQQKPKMELLRAPLKEAHIASPNSLEAWCAITRNTTGSQFQEDLNPFGDDLLEAFGADIRPVKLQVVMDIKGVQKLLFTKLTDGYENSWLDSAEECSIQLEKGWGTVLSDRDNEQYVYKPARGTRNIPAPEDFTDLNEAIQLVLGDNIIDTLDHPAIEKLGLIPVLDEAS